MLHDPLTTPCFISPRDVEHLVHTLGIRTIVDLRSTEESAGDIGDRLAYHHFVDAEGHAKIVNRTKRELGDVFVSPYWLASTPAPTLGFD